MVEVAEIALPLYSFDNSQMRKKKRKTKATAKTMTMMTTKGTRTTRATRSERYPVLPQCSSHLLSPGRC